MFYIDIRTGDVVHGIATPSSTIQDALLVASGFLLNHVGDVVRISRAKSRGVEYKELR